MPLGDGTKIAGYTIRRMLGSGGMGEVYLAQHPRLPREDALKVLKSSISADPDFVERFNREADLAAKLWHPHIVGIHDRGRYRGRLWISMDFVDGTDVGRLLQQKYPDGMPADDALEIVEAVASALDYAHSRGLLHRDVKPANILIADVENDERRILLGDFGVARDLADDAGGGLTQTNMTVGTAAYAAPEQLMGLDVDGRTDQYSLAVTAFHMLTGAPPFQNSRPTVVVGQHLNTPPPLLADTHPELAPLDAAMQRALAKNPDERFDTCTEFARALVTPESPAPAANLDEAETMVRAVAPPPVAPPRAAPAAAPVGRRRTGGWLVAAAAVLVAVAAVLGYLVFAPGKQEPAPEPFTLAGTLRLPDEVVKTGGLPGGYTCAGTKTFGDIGPNTPVTVEDEAGKLLAKGAIRGSASEREGCSLAFRVNEVPSGAKFYRVQVADHPQVNYTEEEAKAGVEFAIAHAQPEPEPSPSPSTVTKTVSPEPAPPPPPPVTPDAERRSLSQLQAYARNDRAYVSLYLADQWLPQLSAKRVGLEAEGTVWDNEQILEEHLAIRDEYPDARLLWSGDWKTFDGRNFWITIVGLTSPDYTDVLAWCSDQGFDRDHCIAKIVSNSRGPSGTTKTNP
ncbi:serine/threonine-protein kinase [Mycolicibacterium monacense]|uniref:serine/threonine-protein kinase n=1 Tax=Mycolicibacterium monacense TaxID=85693 RepID=UPI0007E9C499|nr:serine/threonine-protein kinase [Mycolicibacterium monacense]OBB76198.1 protein kinase [Mycolicibacterium monacense]